MASRQIVVNATITHYADRLAPAWSEHDPSVRLFLDSECERVPTVVQLDPDNHNAVYQATITGVPTRRPLYSTFAIGIKGYLRTTTELGVPVTSDAGDDFILIADVLDAHRQGRDYSKDVELRIPSADDLLKGQFTVTIPFRGGLQMNGATLGRPNSQASQFIGAATEDDVKRAGAPMMAYINESMRQRDVTMKERSETHARVRIPAYIGGPGLMMTHGVPLPAAAFMLYEVPKTNAPFWGNAFRVVMRRDGHTLSDWHHLSIGEKAQVMKEVVCYLPQYLPYKGDTVDKNTRFTKYLDQLKMIGIENFEGALEKRAGDCEDLSEAIMMCRDALAGIQFDEHAHEGLTEMQQIAKEYIAGMVLCTVTSAAVGGADDGNAHMGAHMMVLMTPQAEIKKQIARADPALAARLPWDTQHMRDDLPVMEAEGTGVYYSIAHAEIGASVRSDLYREPCFAAMKAPIFHEIGSHSPFYREGMTVMFPDFARRGSNFIAFWMRDGNDGMRGVKFEHLENKAPNAQLVALPEIPVPIMDTMLEVVKIRVPPEPLTLTDVTGVTMSTTHAEAERICRTVASFGRTAKSEGIPAPMYTRHDLLDPGVADKIIQTFKRKQGVYRVTYNTEPLMDGESPGIRFQIYDDIQMSQPLYLSEEN